MVAVNILERVGLYRTHVTAVGKDGVNMIAVVRGDFNRDALAEGGFCKCRGDRATFARRCRHREFVDGELDRNRVAVAYICKGVGVRNFNGFIVHKQAADMPSCFRNNRIGDVFAA